MSKKKQSTPEPHAVEPESYVFLYRAKTAKGEDAYLYIAVPKDRMEPFAVAMRTQSSMNFEEYGEILASGYGEPDDETKAWMEKNYAFDHANAMQLQGEKAEGAA